TYFSMQNSVKQGTPVTFSHGEVQCSNKYISPGFIDAHMHIESTMVMPIELSKKLLKSGTTTIIADPHELVNVKGASAIDFLLESTK
ncbi:hypothetical protein BM530_21545, partial [Clostridioides difficile]